MSRFAYLAQGRLFLGDSDGETQEVKSRFAEGIRERARATRDRNAWKHEGSGAKFMGAWGARTAVDPDEIRIDITSVSAGAVAGEMFYTLIAPGLCGMMRLDSFGIDEQRLWHSNDTRITDVARQAAAPRIACAVLGAGTAGIGVMNEMGGRLAGVTEGDSLDEAPRWIPGNEDTLVFQSAGIGRNREGHFVGRSPFHVQKLNVETGELSLLAEDARHDLLAPQLDASGALYFIRRPYKFSSGRPWWRLLLDLVLIPWRLLQAIFQFFNFFSMKYTGKPLDPGTLEAGGVARKNLDVERMVLWGNVVEARDAMRRAKPEETPDLVPRSWELVRRGADGRETTLAAGVLSYDLLPDGSILYSNGSAVFLRAVDGVIRRLLRAAYIEKVVIVPE